MTQIWLVYAVAGLGLTGVVLLNLLLSDVFWSQLSKIKEILRGFIEAWKTK